MELGLGLGCSTFLAVTCVTALLSCGIPFCHPTVPCPWIPTTSLDQLLPVSWDAQLSSAQLSSFNGNFP